MSQILVTGGAGFIGSHLVRRYLAKGDQVHVLCRSTSASRRLQGLEGELHIHDLDLRDADGLGKLVQSVQPERIFHLASATVVAGATHGPAELISTNLQGTVNLLAACAPLDYQSFVSTGDSFEYGPQRQRLAEDMACAPDSLHGITKLAATFHARAVARQTGRPIVTLRLYSTYGPADHPRRLVPIVIERALRNEDLPLSQPQVARDWVYVEDVVDLYEEAAERAHELRGGIFNAGSGVTGDLEHVVHEILRLTGSSSQARWGQFSLPPHDEFPWVADPTHTFATFAWRPTTSLADGLARTIAAIRDTLPAID